MLSLLKIRNLALVERLDWELGGGLVGVTGETGAGKSVIVGALKLVLGDRADKGLIRTGAGSCEVEAVFDLPEPEEVNRILDEQGLEPCEEGQLLVRRVMAHGSNRQFVNNCAATLGVLKQIGRHLVDLHGPHDHQALLAVERQLAMLDAHAGAHEARESYRGAWRAWRKKEQEWEELRSAEAAAGHELELLRHTATEIEVAEIDPAEEAELQERYQRASNKTRLIEMAGRALGAIEADQSGIMDRVRELQRLLHDIESHDPAARKWTAGLETAAVEMEDLRLELQRYLEEIDVDPAQAAVLEERVDLLESLKRKYGPTLADVIESGRRAAERLAATENRGALLVAREAEAREAKAEAIRLGEALSGRRRKAAPRLAKDIRRHLQELGFRKAAFEVRLRSLPEPSADGLESVEFEFGPNPGEPLKPLRQIASSGEISRVMLSIKSALAKQDRTPLMVFDEIDANVGGEIARGVGEKMAALGKEHQVVAITHFPQVAASAARHFLVEKRIENRRTVSALREVRDEERIAELVRMLGGGGREARTMAKALLRTGSAAAP